jgi:hypothetical protein
MKKIQVGVNAECNEGEGAGFRGESRSWPSKKDKALCSPTSALGIKEREEPFLIDQTYGKETL